MNEEDFVEEEKISYLYFNRDGTTSHEKKNYSCAYSLTTSKGVEKHYIKFYRGRLFDPYGIDSNKINFMHCEYKKVGKQIIDLYVGYLNNKKRDLFTRAERKCIDV